MGLADWKRAFSAIGRRLKSVGHKASPENDQEICLLVIRVIEDAMWALFQAKGDQILQDGMYNRHYLLLQTEKTNLADRNITAEKLRAARERLLGWQVDFVRDSATQDVEFPERLNELAEHLERKPSDQELPEPWPPLPEREEWWQKAGRQSQDFQAASSSARVSAPAQPLRRAASELPLTGPRPAYHHAYAAPPPAAPPPNPHRPPSYVQDTGLQYQRGHGRNPLSVSAVAGESPFPVPRASTDRSSNASSRGSAWSQGAPIPHMASPYNPGGQPAHSNIELPIDLYGQQLDPNALAYMQQQSWRASMDQSRRR